MGKKTKLGTCCLCLKHGELTFEHVPPQAAFNKSRVQVVTGDAAIELPPGVIEGGDYQQKGMGAYTLCEPCNNNTGGWYGGAFVDWCKSGGAVLLATMGKYSGANTTAIYPLRVIKQILTMFCSVRGAELVQQNPAVQSFLLDRTQVGMPPGLRIYVHYAIGSVHRFTSWAAHLDLQTEKSTPLSEFVFPPFGYLLTYGAPAHDPRPREITSYASHGYDDQLSVDMNLPLLCTLSPMPGDYQTPEELQATKAENDRFMEEWRKKQAARSDSGQ